MGATLTPFAFVLRAGPKHEKYGDPYLANGTVVVLSRVAYVEGASAKKLWKYRKAVIEAISKTGAKEIRFQRIKDGQIRDVVVRL